MKGVTELKLNVFQRPAHNDRLNSIQYASTNYPQPTQAIAQFINLTILLLYMINIQGMSPSVNSNYRWKLLFLTRLLETLLSLQ